MRENEKFGQKRHITKAYLLTTPLHRWRSWIAFFPLANLERDPIRTLETRKMENTKSNKRNLT